MRDSDLVVQARQAATALERAWLRWRVVHGLAADPIPPVSSYVGYSLEEPWGQPRVVFGLAAEEAEQLAGLLDRHECAGPVYATIPPMPGGRHISDRPDGLSAPARVSPLAQPSAAEPPAADDPGPLIQAASAATIEAEARIRAASRERRSSGGIENPYPGTEPDLPGQSQPFGTAASGPLGTAAVVAFRPRPELAAYLDAGPEPDPYFDRQQDSAAASLTRRSWMARGHAIPRLPRVRRPGAAPGA